MVQIFDPTTSYPLSSVVEHRGGLYQKIASASFGSGEPGDASGEWSFLGVDATGVATPEHALLSSATRSTARIFDQETEFDLIDAEEAQGESSSQPGEQYPSSSTIDQLEAIEATLEHQPDLLLAEAAGEHLFKSPRRGLWAYSGSSDPTLERLKEGIYQRVLGAERGDFQAGREAWRAAAVARREVDELPETREASKTLKWILIGPGDPFPRDALPLGAEKASAREEEPIFAARGYHKGAVEIGKCGPHLGRPRHSFALGDRELFFDKNEFEVLCGDVRLVRWVSVPPGAYPPRSETYVEGGRDANGRFIGVGRGVLKGGEHPGKWSLDSPTLLVGYGRKAHSLSGFQCLLYA